VTATPDLFAWAIVTALTLEVLRRTPAAIRNPRGRTLWLVFFALDVSMAQKIQGVGDFLHHLTGWNDIATLVKHLLGVAAVAGLLHWVTSVVPGREDGRREPRYRRAISSRPRRIVTWAAVAVIFFTFWQSQRRQGSAEDGDFIFVQAGHFWGSLHLLLFYAYLIFGLLCASMMCAAASREPSSHGAFKYGMQVLSLGCIVGSMYGFVRSGYLIARLFKKPFLGGEVFVDTASNFCLAGCILLVLAGANAPKWERMDQRVRAHGAVNDLWPMWNRLTTAVPSVIYEDADAKPRQRTLPAPLVPLAGRLHDFWNWKRLDVRLSRRITEICDVSMHLSPYVPPHLYERVGTVVQDLGLPRHTVPAYLLRTAMKRKAAGEPPFAERPDAAILVADTELLGTTAKFLPVGKAMSDNDLMDRLDRSIKAGVNA
jgi:hypothetical protein